MPNEPPHTARISLSLRALLEREEERQFGTRALAAEPLTAQEERVQLPENKQGTKIPLFILSEDEDAVLAIASQSEAISSLADGLLSADVTVNGLQRIMAVPRVRRIQEMNFHQLQLEHALPASGFPQGIDWSPEIELDGTGTLVGVIDTGFDLAHPSFRDRNGRLRVDGLLDQSMSPEGGYRAVEYSTEDLETSWNTGSNHGYDQDGHGTHVASIAGGSPFGSARGVAPEARFLLVKTDFRHTVNALKWVFEQAKGRPCVVNCSFGHHYGPHDGTSVEEREGLEGLCGQGKIVVAAAGNSGRAPVHCSGDFEPGRVRELPFSVEPDRAAITITLWYSDCDQFEIELISPSGKTFAAPDVGAPGVRGDAGAAAIELLRDLYDLSRLVQTQVNVRFPFHGGRAEEYQGWKLRVQAGPVESGHLETWIANQDTGYFEDNPLLNSDCTLVMPATSPHAISVGSFVSSNQWNSDAGLQQSAGAIVGKISRFSSRGPTRDGRKAPDICAPGQYITAALSSQCYHSSEKVLSGSGCLVLQGTSMSSPFITGLLALMLQKKNNLTTAQAKEILRKSAVRDQWTGIGPWDTAYGYGKVCARDAVHIL